MDPRRRRSALELEVQTSVPVPDPSGQAPRANPCSNTAELGEVGREEQQLEPADGGAAAWKVLFATFMFEAILFGEHQLGFAPDNAT